MRFFRSPFTTFFESRGDEWFFSHSARLSFFVATLFVLGLTPVLWGALPQHPSFWLNLLFGLSGVFGTFALFYLYLGMWRFWIRIDSSAKRVKGFWFAVLLLGLWWGSAVYFYLSYLFQTRRGTSEHLPTQAAELEVANNKLGAGARILIGAWLIVFAWVTDLLLFPKTVVFLPNRALFPFVLCLLLGSCVYLLRVMFNRGMTRSRSQ